MTQPERDRCPSTCEGIFGSSDLHHCELDVDHAEKQHADGDMRWTDITDHVRVDPPTAIIGEHGPELVIPSSVRTQINLVRHKRRIT